MKCKGIVGKGRVTLFSDRLVVTSKKGVKGRFLYSAITHVHDMAHPHTHKKQVGDVLLLLLLFLLLLLLLFSLLLLMLPFLTSADVSHCCCCCCCCLLLLFFVF